MKSLAIITTLAALLGISHDLHAQVTNTKINGSTANFSIMQGDSLRWEFDLPVGGTAMGEFWIDLNANGVIDSATDKLLFGGFTQTDGDSSGNNGPGDFDATANGHIVFRLSDNGVPPAKYILRFTNNGQGPTVTGTVIALASPAYTISGNITPPPGVSAQNILVQAKPQNGHDNGTGWLGLTNASGNYVINFNASAGAQTWRIEVQDQHPPFTTPPTQDVNLTGNITGINFSYGAALAQVVGYLKGEDGHVFANAQVQSNPYTNSGSLERYNKKATTNANGFFQFGFSADDITSYSTWQFDVGSQDLGPGYFPPGSGSVVIHEHDSLRVDLTAYVANDSITGRVTIDGHAPGNTSYLIYAGARDSGNTYAYSAPFSGNFTLHVTKKIFQYYVGLQTPPGYGLENNDLSAHAGDKNVSLNLVKLVWIPQTSNSFESFHAVSSPTGTATWVGGTNGTLLHSTNGGDAWTNQSSGTSQSINGISFVDPLTGWIVGDGGMIRKTTNGGSTWNAQTSPTSSSLKAVQFINVNTGWIVFGDSTGDQNLLRTSNGGTTWSSSSIGTVKLTSVWFANASTGWVAGNGGTIKKTTDGGSTWNGESVVVGGTLYCVRFLDTNTGWASGDGGSILKTTNGGTDWMIQKGGGCAVKAVYPLSASVLWAAGECGQIYGSTDGGSHWNTYPNTVNGNLNGIAFADGGNGWAVGDNGTILHNANSGLLGTCSISTLAGWNMVSVPFTIFDTRKSVLFPSAISNAYSYSPAGGYASRDTLHNRPGYWLKYAAPTVENLHGEIRYLDTMAVSVGWNLIGSISMPILKNQVVQSSPDMIQSPFYIFAGGYSASDTLKPGMAYWVKCSQAGYLLLSSVELPPMQGVSNLIDRSLVAPISISRTKGTPIR